MGDRKCQIEMLPKYTNHTHEHQLHSDYLCMFVLRVEVALYTNHGTNNSEPEHHATSVLNPPLL